MAMVKAPGKDEQDNVSETSDENQGQGFETASGSTANNLALTAAASAHENGGGITSNMSLCLLLSARIA